MHRYTCRGTHAEGWLLARMGGTGERAAPSDKERDDKRRRIDKMQIARAVPPHRLHPCPAEPLAMPPPDCCLHLSADRQLRTVVVSLWVDRRGLSGRPQVPPAGVRLWRAVFPARRPRPRLLRAAGTLAHFTRTECVQFFRTSCVLLASHFSLLLSHLLLSF